MLAVAVLALTVADVVEVMSFVLTIGFATDFAYRMKTATNRRHYFFHEFGWADMLASIPLAQTNVLRLFRLIKVYRLLRDYGTRNILRALVRDRAGSALLMLLFGLMAPFLFVGLLYFWLIPGIHTRVMLDANLYELMNWTMAINGVMFWSLILDSRAKPPARLSHLM